MCAGTIWPIYVWKETKTQKGSEGETNTNLGEVSVPLTRQVSVTSQRADFQNCIFKRTLPEKAEQAKKSKGLFNFASYKTFDGDDILVILSTSCMV